MSKKDRKDKGKPGKRGVTITTITVKEGEGDQKEMTVTEGGEGRVVMRIGHVSGQIIGSMTVEGDMVIKH